MWAEARRIGASTAGVHVSSRINVPDGGVDAFLDALVVPADSFLASGNIAFQIKTGDSFKPWRKADLRKELFGDEAVSKGVLAESVRDCLQADGQYVLICTGYCDGPLKLLQAELMSVLLREDTPVDAIVVVDECDFVSQTRLWNQLQHSGPRIKLVSIYNDPEEAAGASVVQDASPLNDGQITEIIVGYGVGDLRRGTLPEVDGRLG